MPRCVGEGGPTGVAISLRCSAVMIQRTVICALWLTLIASPAFARSNAEQAKELYASGARCYRAQDYVCAIELWQYAYEMSPRAALRFDIARAAEKQGNRALAIEEYRAWLDLERRSPERAAVTKHVEQLESQGKPAPRRAAAPAPESRAIARGAGNGAAAGERPRTVVRRRARAVAKREESDAIVVEGAKPPSVWTRSPHAKIAAIGALGLIATGLVLDVAAYPHGQSKLAVAGNTAFLAGAALGVGSVIWAYRAAVVPTHGGALVLFGVAGW